MISGHGKTIFSVCIILVVISAILCFHHIRNAQISKGSAPNQTEQSEFSIRDAQISKSNAFNQTEQSEFGIELEDEPIRRPAELPRAALDALSKDDRVAGCLRDNDLTAKQLPANWFAASEIHLAGPNEVDLVVLPTGRVPDTPPGEISPSMCLIGANTAQMWVLRKTQTGFQVVLSQNGLGLSVLSSRTRDFRDISVGAMVGGYGSDIEYKFDGKSYQMAGRTSKLAGAELPSDLSGYETREPLIQLPGQSAESVRAQARAWIWEKWSQITSYLKVETRDDEADETTSYYIAQDKKGEWQITIETHRVLSATPTQGSITEDRLSVATDIERIEPVPEGSSQLPRIIPDTENVPASEYRLQFLDYADREIGTL